MKNSVKIVASVIALVSAAPAMATTITLNSSLDTAIGAIDDLYDHFDATTSERSNVLGHLQDLVENANSHGTTSGTAITVAFNSDGEMHFTVAYDFDDNMTDIGTAKTGLIEDIKTDFFGSSSGSADDIGVGSSYSTTDGSATLDLQGGSVLTSWATASGGIDDEFGDLIDAMHDFNASSLDSTALASFETHVTAMETAAQDFNDGLGEAVTALGSTGAGLASTTAVVNANWAVVAASSASDDWSSMGDAVTVTYNGNTIDHLEDEVEYYVEGVDWASAMTYSGTEYDDGDALIAALFN